MNFDLTPDQQALQSSAQTFIGRESPPSRLRRLRTDPIGYSPGLWRQMGELGWLGVLFPESLSGFGGSFVDAALIIEQLGSSLVPEPYIPALVLGGMAILRAGTEEQQRRWLPALIAGQTTLALAYAESHSRFEVAHVTTRASRHGDSYSLHGQKRFVLNGHAADAIVVSARTAGDPTDRHGVSLFVVDRNTPGLKVTPITTMDSHRGALLELDGVELAADRRLDGANDADAAVQTLEWVMDLGAAAACVEGVGIMRAVMDMTTEYLRTREQFGKKIGSFQALQHRAVDMFIETELARSTAILASIKVDDPDPRERQSAVSAAKVQLCQSGRFVTQQAIQLHGGIGITDEHDVGLYFKRMHVLCTLFGDEEFHVARYADLPGFTAGL